MKFETGKNYKINKYGVDSIHVKRRTAHYITFISSIDGTTRKKKILKDRMFNGAEYVLTPCRAADPSIYYFCVSDSPAKIEYEYYKTAFGYHIRRKIPGCRFWEYMRGYRNGVYSWISDHTYARCMSLKTAEKHYNALTNK